MIIKIIQHGSREYEQMLLLRIDVLLNPINIAPSYINREKENEDILIGAFEEDEMIGCCVLTKKDEFTLQLRQMAVRVNRQTKGAGTAILNFAEKITQEKGYRCLMMHARDVVIPFYQKCGYTIIGNGFTEVGIPHHVMEKSIN